MPICRTFSKINIHLFPLFSHIVSVCNEEKRNFTVVLTQVLLLNELAFIRR